MRERDRTITGQFAIPAVYNAIAHNAITIMGRTTVWEQDMRENDAECFPCGSFRLRTTHGSNIIIAAALCPIGDKDSLGQEQYHELPSRESKTVFWAVQIVSKPTDPSG